MFTSEELAEQVDELQPLHRTVMNALFYEGLTVRMAARRVTEEHHVECGIKDVTRMKREALALLKLRLGHRAGG